MTTGTIKYFNPAKGFGFISSDAAGGKDVFFHVSKVKYLPDAESSLVEGATPSATWWRSTPTTERRKRSRSS